MPPASVSGPAAASMSIEPVGSVPSTVDVRLDRGAVRDVLNDDEMRLEAEADVDGSAGAGEFSGLRNSWSNSLPRRA
jgi:hypothetical protein